MSSSVSLRTFMAATGMAPLRIHAWSQDERQGRNFRGGCVGKNRAEREPWEREEARAIKSL
ncbi:Putative LOC100878358 [Caligus rogercresseyi]|uniref:LOC100878358 n=1 Tax=Caligus rogercresseyi TaxID=217165 RepID=A0A7T8KLP3_CALRO|nr:Putative LOC100878358 [Caligus rogercresseyi]